MTETEQLLAGGGDMGALMRAKDWENTPLGPVSEWPQSLRTTVSTCINSRFPIFVWWGPQLVMLYNDAYREMLGDKHPASLGAPGKAVWPEIWPIIGPMLEGVMTRGEATWSENQLLKLRRRGFSEETYFTFSYSPIRDETGGVGGVYCAVTETTGQVIGERRLQLLQQVAVRTTGATSSEDACARVAEVLSASPADVPFALVYHVDSDGRRAALGCATGLSRGSALAPERVELTAPGVWPLETASRGEVLEIADVAAHLQPLGLSLGEVGARSALVLPVGGSDDGHVRSVLVVGTSAELVLDDRYRAFLNLLSGQLATALSSARTLEETRRRAEALAELDRAKTTFFSNVSHEFRTPLTLMVGPTEDALASPSRALQGEQLETVYRNELRLLKLVNALLDFSRIEAGRARAAWQPADLATLTTDLASAFRSAMQRAGLTFEVDCASLPEPVWVDTEMWEKIVLNLVSNAFKFTFEGTIRVALKASGDRVELTVSDTGVGIAADDLPRVFERFHRIEGSRARTYEGTGIGLALVHSLVELHGGSITVDSATGRGTRFTVSLRRGTAHLPPGARDAASARGKSSHVHSYVAEALRWLPDAAVAEAGDRQLEQPVPVEPGEAARVLVVDDNADMRDYLQRLLTPHWSVELAADGAQALARARRRLPDLVLTDVMMPRMNGFQLLQTMRADPALSRIPVIMVSARAGEEALLDSIQAGADDYVVKPFSARELVARVRSHLLLAQGARERAELLAREQEARREAELQREHLHGLFNQAPTPICVLRGPEHVVELANASVCEVWNRHPVEVLGRPLLDVLPELRDQVFKQLLDGVLQTGTPHVGKETVARLVRDGGRVEDVYFNFVYQPLRGVSGEVEGVMVVAFNVTDEVLAREQMSSLRAQAEVASRTKDEFLAMLGHELRNPLAPIKTALELMRLRGDGRLDRERTIIERQVGQLVTLVDDLLDVSRIVRGKIDLHVQRVELCEVVAKAIEMASPLLEQREHQLLVDVPREGLAVDGDVARLAQVLANLLTNAAKYTPECGRIEVTARRHGEGIALSVKDNGIGIAPELLPQVFEMFVQEKQAIDRRSGGLGLGLTIARRLTAQHGGTLEAHSDGLGRGSVFTVKLPASKHASAAPPELLLRQLPEAARGNALRVLVVDDNTDAGETLAEYVSSIGHHSRIAHDGPEALRVAAEFTPAVALVDLGLPVMDGFEVARKLRELPGAEGLKLFAVTGYGQPADQQRTRKAGFDAHLVKPVDLEKLDRLLEAVRG